MQFQIERIKERGNFSIYKRMWGEPGLKRYMGFEFDNIVKEFSNLRQADKWLRSI